MKKYPAAAFFWRDIFSDSGASTITMQLARLALNNPSRTYGATLREFALALQLETQRNKNDFLKLYATHAPYGGNVVGLQAASWRFLLERPINCRGRRRLY
jgi:penicillin-binding protein 1C